MECQEFLEMTFSEKFLFSQKIEKENESTVMSPRMENMMKCIALDNSFKADPSPHNTSKFNDNQSYRKYYEKLFKSPPIYNINSLGEGEEKSLAETIYFSDENSPLFNSGLKIIFPSENKKSLPERKMQSKISSDLLIRSYHQLHNNTLTLSTYNEHETRSSFGQNDRYSRRRRFPKLNHLTGERLVYEYKKGQLTDTKALMQEKNSSLQDHISKLNSSLLNQKNSKLKKRIRANKQINGGEKINIKYFNVPQKSEKLLLNNKSQTTKLTCLKSDGNNCILINDKMIENVQINDNFIIQPKIYFSLKNFSQNSEFILRVTIVD